MSDTIRESTWARIRLKLDCPGEPNKPHHLAEDADRAFVTSVDRDEGGRQQRGPYPPGGIGIGWRFRPDELEPIPEP
jgi:hypothetical protein